MTSELKFNSDHVVVGPVWSEDVCREVVRAVRKATASDVRGRVAVLVRLAHEVLSERPEARDWPVFSPCSSTPRMYYYMLRAATYDDFDAFDVDDEFAEIRAVNVARWLLQLPQLTLEDGAVYDPPECPEDGAAAPSVSEHPSGVVFTGSAPPPSRRSAKALAAA